MPGGQSLRSATPRAIPSSLKGNSDAAAVQQNLSELPGLLSSGLQGIGGTSEQRIAMIHNTIIEVGRSTVIPLVSGARTQTVAVRCRDITKDSVVLDVEGYGPVVVTRKHML
jgi:hypothetical protein